MSERDCAALELPDRETADRVLRAHPALLVYVTAPDCGICQALWPKLCAYLEENYPRLVLVRLDAAAAPDTAAFFSVHTVPTVLVFFEGREHHRFSHAFGVHEIGAAIHRPYDLLFDQDDARD